jgi:hypothetical protein
MALNFFRRAIGIFGAATGALNIPRISRETAATPLAMFPGLRRLEALTDVWPNRRS